MAFIEVRDVTKTYKMGEVEIKAVDEIGFGIDKGEFVVIVGPSGAGKLSSLLPSPTSFKTSFALSGFFDI